MVRAKVSLTVAPSLSVATTSIFTVPTSPFSGVPENVPVSALNVNQSGIDKLRT